MSIIVKGEPMPEACAFCPCFRDDSIDGVHAYQCKATFITYGKEDDWIWNTRPNWCPLVELPEKHGDLIDRQKLIEDNKHLEYPTDGKYRRDRAWAVGFNAGAKHCNEHAVYAKTVIEAEGAEE